MTNIAILEELAELFEAGATEIRSARLHDGEITREQMFTLTRQARRNADHIRAVARRASYEIAFSEEEE